jgi:two-component system, chemotaxis family, response regulator Rcp1
MRRTVEGEGMPLTILLVEDNPGDVRLMQEVLHATNNSLHLVVASDGVEALALLTRAGTYAHAPRPDLILLDLNLPKMDGHAVLAHIKEDPNFKTIPTVILTTSDSEADIEQSYQLQANCYLSKPMELSAFEKLLRGLNDFWLTRAILPQQGQTT